MAKKLRREIAKKFEASYVDKSTGQKEFLKTIGLNTEAKTT
jgi:hypothetical protein